MDDTPIWPKDHLGDLGSLEQHERMLAEAAKVVDALAVVSASRAPTADDINSLLACRESMYSILSALGCLGIAGERPSHAPAVLARVHQTLAALDRRWSASCAAVAGLSPAQRLAILTGPLASADDLLQRMIQQGSARGEGASEAERLLDRTDQQGLHGWCALRHMLMDKVVLIVQGQEQPLSRLDGLLESPDAGVRAEALAAAHREIGVHETALVCALNHVRASRVRRLELLGHTAMEATAIDNDVHPDVLAAMVGGMDRIRPTLIAYLRWKAGRAGQDKLPWSDLYAPVAPARDPLAWSEAVDCVLEAFEPEPDLRRVAASMLRGGAVHARPTARKPNMGQCLPLVVRKTTRISVQFDGSLRSVLLLAHELGHAWHTMVLLDVEPWAREVSGTMAETASMYAEALAMDHIVRRIPEASHEASARSLDHSVALLVDSYSRFLFERSLYDLPESAHLSADAIRHLQRQAQDDAFDGVLSAHDDYLWARKTHLFLGRKILYNWLYPFGYLLGAALSEAARTGRASMREILELSGRRPPERLIRETLGADLRDEGFWSEAGSAIRSVAQAIL